MPRLRPRRAARRRGQRRPELAGDGRSLMLKHELAALIGDAIQSAQASGALPAFDLLPVDVEHPREAAHGDYATSVAMKLARQAKLPPLKIAQAIAVHLPQDGMIGSAV